MNEMNGEKNEPRKGSRKLLLEQYDRYYRLALSYVHKEEDAADIVQNGAYKAILNSSSPKNPEYASTWGLPDYVK